MAEFASSIASLVDLAVKVAGYVIAVKGAPDEQKRLRDEIGSACFLLQRLGSLVTEDSPCAEFMETMRTLTLPDGALEQFRTCLEKISKKIKNSSSTNKFKVVGSAVFWPFKKAEVFELIATLERLKSIFNLALQSDHMALSLAMNQHVLGIGDKVGEVLRKVDEAIEEQKASSRVIAAEEKKRIEEWLSPLNFWVTQGDTLRRRHRDTGNWITEAQVFQQWLNTPGKTLWCPGDPGAGKTTLSAVVVDYIRQNYCIGPNALACVYFNYKDQGAHDAPDVIGAVLKQLVESRRELSQHIEQAYSQHVNGRSRLTREERSILLRSEVSQFARVFIVVDALDESPETKGARREIVSELKELGSKANILVTSRPLPLIEQDFRSCLRLEIRAQDDDVRTYIRGRLENDQTLVHHLRITPVLATEIEEAIVKKVQGMFLLAELHLNSLAACDNRRDLKNALLNFTSNYDRTYEAAMDRTFRQEKKVAQRARQVLLWITHAYRPLSEEEIQHAIAVELGDEEFDEDAVVESSYLVSICCGLVTTREQKLWLVHYTLEEYLNRHKHKYFPQGQDQITKTCLTYLSFDDLGCGPVGEWDWESRVKRFGKLRLLEYASTHWGSHARDASDPDTLSAILAFLDQRKKVASALEVMEHQQLNIYEHSFSGPREGEAGLIGLTPLWHASSFGLVKVMEHVLQTTNMSLVDQGDSFGRTPLYVAISNGHLAAAEMLLKAGARMIPAIGGTSPMHRAALRGDVKLIRLCYENGADINASDSHKTTILHNAAQSGSVEACQALLDWGVDTSLVDEGGNTALHTAARWGRRAASELFIRRGMSIYQRDYWNSSVLMKGVLSGQLDLVRLLLDEGAEVDIPKDQYYTYEQKDHQELATEPQATISKSIYVFGTPLLAAAHMGFDEMFELLLQYGADLYAKNSEGETVLFEAAANDHSSLVENLLRLGLDPSDPRNDGNIPLNIAVRRLCTTVPLLLEADPQALVKEADVFHLLREHPWGVFPLLSPMLARLDKPLGDRCLAALPDGRSWIEVLDHLGNKVEITEEIMCGIASHNFSSETDNPRICKILLDRGISMPCTEKVLDMAFRKRDWGLLNILMAQGAKITVTESLLFRFTQQSPRGWRMLTDPDHSLQAILMNKRAVTVTGAALGMAAVRLGVSSMQIEQLAGGRIVHITALAFWLLPTVSQWSNPDFDKNLRAVFSLPSVKLDEDAFIRLGECRRGGHGLIHTILERELCTPISQDILRMLAKHGNAECLKLALGQFSGNIDAKDLLSMARCKDCLERPNEDVVRFLIDRYPEPSDSSNDADSTATATSAPCISSRTRSPRMSSPAAIDLGQKATITLRDHSREETQNVKVAKHVLDLISSSPAPPDKLLLGGSEEETAAHVVRRVMPMPCET